MLCFGDVLRETVLLHCWGNTAVPLQQVAVKSFKDNSPLNFTAWQAVLLGHASTQRKNNEVDCSR